MGIEARHEDEGNIYAMSCVQMFDLSDGKIKEGHVVLNFKR